MSMQRAPSPQKPIKVLIVDDSKVGRAVIGKILLEASPRVTIVGYAEDGKGALNALDVCQPDVVILDLAMPSMDGITALPLILQKRPDVRVIICSSLSSPGAEISVKALSLGATDCVPKPVGSKNEKAIADFKDNLARTVLGLFEAQEAAPAPRLLPMNRSMFRPKVLAIGSSTGGPQALLTLLKDIGPLPIPVIITQHMINTFTAILARQIAAETGIRCEEGCEDMMLEPQRIFIAPGGRHMLFKRSGQGVAITLDDGPPENFCKPAVDVMLRGAVQAYGGDVMAVILTGMGKDGMLGCDKVAKAGGRVVVQDRDSSVVWGMPGAVANAGLASAILPLQGIARAVKEACAKPADPAGAR